MHGRRISGPPSLLQVCEGDPSVGDSSAAGTHKRPPLGDDGASCMAVDQAPPEEPRVLPTIYFTGLSTFVT